MIDIMVNGNDDSTSANNDYTTAGSSSCSGDAPPAVRMDERQFHGTKKQKQTNGDNESSFRYNPKKPKWWNRLGNNGRDATKSQKKAIRRVLDDEGLRLPQIPYGSILDWNDTFPESPSSSSSSSSKREIWLELGFGRGENLQALLETKRRNGNDFYLVGAEVSGVGIGCLCKRIDQKLQRGDNQSGDSDDEDDGYVLYDPSLDPHSETPTNHGGDTTKDDDNTTTSSMKIVHRREETLDGHNDEKDTETTNQSKYYRDRLRIHAGDGYKLLPKLPNHSLSVILITFPDPFPKDSDVNYRLVQEQTLLECHRLLIPNSGRLLLATDHNGYHQWCHERMEALNYSTTQKLFREQEPCPDRKDWLPAISRYEQKGWNEGRSTKLVCWRPIVEIEQE